MNLNQMNVGMDFISNPIIPGEQYNTPQPMPNYVLPVPQPVNKEPDLVVTAGKGLFTVIPDEDTPKRGMVLTSPDADMSGSAPKRQYNRKKKDEIATVDSKEIVRADNTEPTGEMPSIYNYAQTASLLGDTLGQVDMLAGELKNEFDNVRCNRALKNKYIILTNLSDSMSQLLNTKANILKEINNSITKAMDLDYKKEKDKRAAEQIQNDDKYIQDLYNSFINNPYNTSGNAPTLGPTPINNTVNSFNGSGIIRSPLAQSNPAPNGVIDMGYLNYLNRITPEQNAMFYETDPNVKTAVVYDMSTGRKFFQVMNMATGQAIPNMDIPNERFLEDTVIDLQNNIAKNSNLHETYPLVVLNGNPDIANNY